MKRYAVISPEMQFGCQLAGLFRSFARRRAFSREQIKHYGINEV